MAVQGSFESTYGDGLVSIHDWKAANLTDGAGAKKRLCALINEQRLVNKTSHTWISLATQQQIEDQWAALHQKDSQPPESFPLYGVPFAVKDNIDAEGFETTAACPAFAYRASCDAPVVARLKAVGAILIGKTNLDQFATGLNGTRSPYGAVPNSFDPSRVSGGSSSGSAVVVAKGIVPFSLGTDTAGSGRVPAGLNNVVGLKPTRGAISARGVVPACRTLDCVSIFALTVGDAEAVLSICENYDPQDAYSRRRPRPTGPVSDQSPEMGCRATMKSPSLAICSHPDWHGNSQFSRAYHAALQKAQSLGWKLVSIDFDRLFQLAQLLYGGPWVAERYQAIKRFIQTAGPQDMDPVVRGIIESAERFTAADLFESEYLRQQLTRQICSDLAAFDGLLVPTAPTFPTLEQMSRKPVEENSTLGTYTNFVNFLDWSALSIPAAFTSEGLPFGITLIANSWQEPQLVAWARQWFSGEIRPLGATKVRRAEEDAAEKAPSDVSCSILNDTIHIAVVGAHLSGCPLNKDLSSRGAVLHQTTRTSPSYRLLALESDRGLAKPGLRRVSGDDRGAGIEAEVWALPTSAFAEFSATVPSPFALGKVELQDGSWVHGFVCEPVGLQGAIDITAFGGWRAYRRNVTEAQTIVSRSAGNSIKRVLIANRGEIAVRIIRTLHKMGLESVAIYSSIDADAAHVRQASIALPLEGCTVSETYLNIPQILARAVEVAADAIIPGYGFLAESADFAGAVQTAGMNWIGPRRQQMSDLGLKHRARAIAMAADVPVVPGSYELIDRVEDAVAEAARLGYPLMLKSTAGGGGIGLSRCEDEASLRSAFEGVQRQAQANFGNGGVFLERFVQQARHIEVQILGDGAGKVLVAGERDCSLQRRHQKVVEESPAIMVPEEVREKMRAAAVRIASSVQYLNVGTVEFIYDVNSRDFYFLEINTRLQVEHPVTEQVTGLDLVECMVKIANRDCDELFASAENVQTSGASIEIRVYAESPLEQFQPCAGRVSRLHFPEGLRVDTWIEEGTEVTLSYDPLLAKIIAFGADRQSALRKLRQGLDSTIIEGVQNNLAYLKQIVASEMFENGSYTTKSLDSFQMLSDSFEVLEAGTLTTIQDYPGRKGYWSVGIPPSGPMDDFSFRMANRLVRNPLGTSGLECTFHGPTLRFHCTTTVAITGGTAPVEVDGKPVKMNQALQVLSGQTLRVGTVEHGLRVYVALRGGIGTPLVMGSQATFEIGKLGDFKGRKLQCRDVVPLASPLRSVVIGSGTSPHSAWSAPIPRQPDAHWTIQVIPGPHGAPDYFTPAGLEKLFSSEWTVHHNSNRLGVRLGGPHPEWSRQSGGEAGLHPSNIHDSPYSIGSVSFTGDEAVILGCDGPSLGGFVVFCVVASVDLWKIGQVRPGDKLRFAVIDCETALKLDEALLRSIESLEQPAITTTLADAGQLAAKSAAANRINFNEAGMTARQAGDCGIVLELGDDQTFELRQSFKIFAFCEHHRKVPIPGVQELTPGVCTLHVTYEKGIPPQRMLRSITEHWNSCSLLTAVPSRTIKLPFAFDDQVCRKAVERYAATIRDEAPWLPSNISFLEKLNGIEDILETFLAAQFLVIGLGDVFMGSPCAIPLDPRHRLFGTKYNPSRSHTPRGAVGIGGQYMCIYAADSPGGYQLVGRTSHIWNDARVFSTGPNSAAMENPPWLFRMFDRITFYPVSEGELDSRPASELIQVQDGMLKLADYEAWLEENKGDIDARVCRRADIIANSPFAEKLRRPYVARGRSETRLHSSKSPVAVSNAVHVKAMMPGRCYKVHVKVGDSVCKNDILACIESSKMEIQIRSPAAGRCAEVLVAEGDLVGGHDDMVILDSTDSS
ncbi:Urea carboxylase [Moelleriella libera RCEF 2490]|uniref:Urea carboxylase n=1 Tax=Moelleriella libera RCEF 2490 TaxID=1081109 RepID=A0A167ZM85_9HYPO|nr:Urea carboxylase [Moelleriella libera RCEF 2490]